VRGRDTVPTVHFLAIRFLNCVASLQTFVRTIIIISLRVVCNKKLKKHTRIVKVTFLEWNVIKTITK